MDELARVLADPGAVVGYRTEDESLGQWEARAVRAYLASDAAVERAAKAHCDFFGGEGWWETGLLADTLPKGREAARAALTAAVGDGK